MSKLAIFLLNLAKIGLPDFWTPLVLELNFFDENKRKKNVEIRPFLSKLAWKRFLSYEPVKINFRGDCFFETTRHFIQIVNLGDKQQNVCPCPIARCFFPSPGAKSVWSTQQPDMGICVQGFRVFGIPSYSNIFCHIFGKHGISAKF